MIITPEQAERMKVVAEKMLAKKVKADEVKAEYKSKAKTKALTQAERLDRIEKILGIE